MRGPPTVAICSHSRSGFTLVEISIVLVIIGLIVGGVLVGRELIRAAELNSVIKDVTTFNTGINVFRMRYHYLPGDIPNATRYWATCVVSPFDPLNTCDGNADGLIQPWSREGIRAWQHLDLSQIIPSGSTGIDDGVDNKVTPGVNTPRSKVGGGYMFIYENSATYGRRDNALWLANETGATSLSTAVLLPIDAAAIDSKGDDGRADGGDIYARNGAGYDKTSPDACVDGDPSDATAAYNLENTEITCRLTFWVSRR